MCLVVMPGQCVLVWYCNEAVLLKDICFYDHTQWAGSELELSVCKQKAVGSNPAEVEKIFRSLVHLARTRHAMG